MFRQPVHRHRCEQSLAQNGQEVPRNAQSGLLLGETEADILNLPLLCPSPHESMTYRMLTNSEVAQAVRSNLRTDD